MARGNAGAGWMGVALIGGVPVTLALLFVNPPLAILVGIGTFVVWKVGSNKQAEEEFDERSREIHYENEEREAKRRAKPQ